MEHIMLSNHAQADEALTAASKLCSDDPLLVNEQGVMRFNHSE
jgi:anaphase-promoting complex subunit 6